MSDTEPEISKQTRWKWLTFAIFICMFIIWYFFTLFPGRIDYFFQMRHLNQIVNSVKQKGIAPETRQDFMSHRSWGNTTLGTANRKQVVNHHEGLVIAIRRDNGKYHIEIITKDYGHAGTYGYTYDDDPAEKDLSPDAHGIKAYWNNETHLLGPWFTGYNGMD